MSHTHPKHIATLFATLLAANLVGCAEEAEVEPACSWIVSPTECEPEGDDEVGETGDPLPDYGCVIAPDGIPRTVFQCEGELTASISFNTTLGNCAESLGYPELCDEFHAFGPGDDAYETPAVMACCDADVELEGDVYLSACGADMIQQFCASLPHRLQSYIDQDAFPIGENQAQKLQNYLATHQEDCYANFNQPTDVPGLFETTSWLVNGGGNADWPLLEDFTITLESGVVNSASLPEDPADYLSCDDNNFNNTEVFEDEVPNSPGINSFAHLADASPATMVGPVVQGGRVTGVSGLSSLASACQDPWCSTMEVTVDLSTRYWTLEDLNLYADGLVSFTNGTATLDVERGAIRLYRVALGNIQTDRSGADVYTVQAGAGGFVISGGSGFGYEVRWATNASPITMHKTQTGWAMDSFVMEHIDRSGERWTLTLPSTTWE